MINLPLLKLKAGISAKTTLHVLKNWRYGALAAVFAVLFLIFIYWILNIELFWYLLSSGALSLGEKLSFIVNSTIGYLTDVPLPQAIATTMLVIGQGIVIAMLIYIVRTQKMLDSKALGGSTIASVIALFSVGCVSCGTSIVAPIVGLFVSGASASLSETINGIAVYFSLALVLYALYAVGLTASGYVARQKQAVTAPIND